MASPTPASAAELYLDLLEGVLTRILFVEDEDTREVRRTGRDWPPDAETMIGLERLRNVRTCVQTVVDDGVPGDLIEAGVWRGGAAIYMRAVLAALGVVDRMVWVADSFQGLPSPDPTRYETDEGASASRLRFEYDWFSDEHPELIVPLEKVQENFTRFGLLDGQVSFLEGWFHETLPHAPIQRLALIRADGDLYESTWDVLSALYPRLSPGGFVVIDDYGGIDACRKAVDDFRASADIVEPLVQIDWTGVYWRRAG